MNPQVAVSQNEVGSTKKVGSAKCEVGNTSAFRLPTSDFGAAGRALAILCAMVLLCAAPSLAGEPGASGDLYVPVGDADSVVQYDGVSGAWVADFVGSGSGGLNDPIGVAFDGGGNLFVASYATDEVLEYDGLTGAFVGVFAAGGGLNGPYGITFGPGGNLYVCSFLTSQVIEYEASTGTPLGVFASGGGLGYPMDLTFGPGGNLFVSSYSSHSVIEYDGLTGGLIGTFASGGGLSGPAGLVFGPNGNLFVAGYNNDAVLEFDGSTGAPLGTFASGGGLDGAFGLAFGPDSGNLLVSGYASDNVIEYDGASGALIGTFVTGVGSAGLIEFKPYLGPFPTPDVTGFDPAAAGNCGLLVGATITGTGLVQGAQLTLTRTGEPDIPGWVTGVVPDTELTANFDLTGVALGYWDLVLTYPDEQTNTLVDALEVTECPAPTVTDFAPAQADNCGPLVGATITGLNFTAGTTVKLTMTGESDIVGTNVDVQSTTTIRADFDLTGVAIGLWDVVITRPDEETATLAAALDVTGCPPGVSSISPSVACADNNGSQHHVWGSAFLFSLSVKLSRAGEPDIEGTVILDTDYEPGRFQVCFDLTGAAPGLWDVVVTNPGGPSSTLADGLTVSGAAPGLWDLVVTNPWGQSDTLPDAVRISLCHSFDYTLYDLFGRREGFEGQAHDVNDAGTVAGSGVLGPAFYYLWVSPIEHAFTWSGGAVTDLGVVEDRLSSRSAGYAISADGTAFGFATYQEFGESSWRHRPAMFTNGEVLVLDTPVETRGNAYLGGANDGGTLACGDVYVPYDREYPALYLIDEGTSFVVPDPPAPPVAAWINTPDVNDGGTVVLVYFSSPTRSFLYQHPEGTHAEIVNPLGGGVLAAAINNAGMLVGGASSYGTFCYFNETMTSLGPGGGAYDVSEHGDAVGSWKSASPHATLFARGHWIDLQTEYLEPLTGQGWAYSSMANAINNQGWIVGWASSFGWFVPSWRDYPWLLVPNLKGDFDSDHHVTVDDFAVLADCLGGPGVPPDPTPPTDPTDCLTAFDFDDDGDVDLADFAAFQRALPRDGQAEPGACCHGDGSCTEE